MKIFLYGITGADQMYRVAKYWCFFDVESEPVTIRDIIYQASMLRIKNPSIEQVYAIDDRHGLRSDFRYAMKKNSIESWAIFKNILETEGLRVI